MREYDDNQPAQEYSITPPKFNYTISFNNKEGQQVGGFDFNGEEMVFTGQADESAKIFVEWIANVFKGRLEEEYQRGLKDGAK